MKMTDDQLGRLVEPSFVYLKLSPQLRVEQLVVSPGDTNGRDFRIQPLQTRRMLLYHRAHSFHLGRSSASTLLCTLGCHEMRLWVRNAIREATEQRSSCQDSR
jgi:hypothetical protein